MDREEAIKALEYELSCVDAESPRGELAEPALIMAIEALSAKAPTKCIAEIKIDADEVAQKIKEKYDLADRPSVAYICDGTACGGECDECNHTTDIEHAKNFKCVGGKYIETDDRPSGEWSVEKVAELLADLFGDECACNYNGIDEWLPQSCKYADTECPDPKEKHGCWIQFLKHRGAKMGGNK